MKPLVFSVLPRPPHPTRDGLAIRNYHLLEALAGAFRVRALSLLDPERSYGRGEAPAGVDVEFVAQVPRSLRRVGAAVAGVFSGRSYSEWLYRSPALVRVLRARSEAERPSWVVAHSYHVAPAALSSGSPVWIDFHNLDSQIWERTGQSAASAAAGLFARAQAPRVRALERRLAAAADGISCTTARDGAALAALGARADPVVIANGVDLPRYPFRSDHAPGEVVFFVGDLSWPPNAEAIRWFAAAVWPLIRTLRPEARAEVLGRGAPADVRRLAATDFTLLGEGDDTRPHWSRAAVAVVPLLAGGGSRLKILEAAAAGVPVVSTSVGAEGLELAPDAEIRIADGAADFAAAVAGLLADPAAGRRQAAAARARVEALYDWKVLGRRFADALRRRGEAA